MADLAPSLLSADFADLGREVARLEALDVRWMHLDVMDGRFVPNITFGPPVVQAIRSRSAAAFLDVHLMILEPERYVDAFADAGADVITLHAEASVHLERALSAIRERGLKAGLAFNPATPVGALEHVLHVTDLVLVMTVNPGFGGQRLIPAALSKVTEVKRIIDAAGADVRIEVDGGITLDNMSSALALGADVIVAGSAVFSADDVPGRIRSFHSELSRSGRSAAW